MRLRCIGGSMALNKTIVSKNGATLTYHRISLVNVQVNQQITILVESYIDADGRKKEKDYAKIDHTETLQGEDYAFPYVESEYISFNYDENSEMFKGNIVQKAYHWLKKQEKFKNAKDVLEV